MVRQPSSLGHSLPDTVPRPVATTWVPSGREVGPRLPMVGKVPTAVTAPMGRTPRPLEGGARPPALEPSVLRVTHHKVVAPLTSRVGPLVPAARGALAATVVVDGMRPSAAAFYTTLVPDVAVMEIKRDGPTVQVDVATGLVVEGGRPFVGVVRPETGDADAFLVPTDISTASPFHGEEKEAATLRLGH